MVCDLNFKLSILNIFRKKRREVKRMDKARKKAATIIENEDLGNREKVSEIKKLYKRAAAGKFLFVMPSLFTRFSYFNLRPKKIRTRISKYCI
jgi:hypothetical protein